jgi:hypothetical protein
MVGVGTFFCLLVKMLDRSKLQVESVRCYRITGFVK